MIDNSQTPKISFCITCKNRFYQIKKTLPKVLLYRRDGLLACFYSKKYCAYVGAK